MVRSGALFALCFLFVLVQCSSANIAANEAAVENFLNTANNDIQAAWAGILQNCNAIQALASDAQVLACQAKTSTSTQNAVQRGIAAAQSVCSGTQPSTVTIATVAIAVAQAYAAAKNAQLGQGCGT
jgi:hypothetical protein